MVIPLLLPLVYSLEIVPENKVHGANMGTTWGRQDPGGPHVGHVNFAIWDMPVHTEFKLCIVVQCVHVATCYITDWSHEQLVHDYNDMYELMPPGWIALQLINRQWMLECWVTNSRYVGNGNNQHKMKFIAFTHRQFGSLHLATFTYMEK